MRNVKAVCTERLERNVHHPLLQEAAMSTDLELIEQFQKEIGKKLEKLARAQIMPGRKPGFSSDKKGNVIGLNLFEINLKPFSTSISKFKNLRKLNLLRTQLHDISFLEGLVDLTELSLSGNQITDISPLRELINLEELFLTGNQITDISPLVKLIRLERLGLSNNKIKFLPGEFFELEMEIVFGDESKDGIHLDGNPIENPPLDIVKQGKQAVKVYLDKKKLAGTGGSATASRQVGNKGNDSINIDMGIDLHALKTDFFKLKEMMDEVKKGPKLKEELKKIEDSLDELTLEPEKSKLVKPLNKIGRLLEQMGDEKSGWGKVLKGAQKSVGLAWKLGCTYNKFAQWLALPAIEKPVILNIESNSRLSIKIKKITLKNFKGFEYREIPFSDRFNLLLGDNGSGKTAVLDALALILNSIFIGFDETEKRSPIKDEDVRQVFNYYDDEIRMEPNYPVLIEAQGDVMEYPVHWNKRRSGSQSQTDDADWDLTAITAGFNPHVRHGNPVTLPVIAYYGTGRLWLRLENEKVEPIPPVSRLHAYKDCLDPRSDEKELVRWMKEQELTKIQRKQPSGLYEAVLYEAVKKAITDCIEEYKEIGYDVRHDSIMVKLNDEHWLPAYLCSDGYRNMIAMVADIAYRMAMLNPHLGPAVTQKTPGVVLIDEIDLHLHPKWQRRVVNDLKRAFPGVQFIATSHSPFIVQSLKSVEELIKLDGQMEPIENIDMSIEDIAEDIMNVHIPQKSKRYLDMMKTAEQYYDLLEEGKSAENDDELKGIKDKLDELSIPFSDDPALQAFLKMERTAAGLNETDRKRKK
jgi:predicted ATP-binding protein involved in virulence/Leucine-rich repeat (LRR) protein